MFIIILCCLVHSVQHDDDDDDDEDKDDDEDDDVSEEDVAVSSVAVDGDVCKGVPWVTKVECSLHRVSLSRERTELASFPRTFRKFFLPIHCFVMIFELFPPISFSITVSTAAAAVAAPAT